MLASLAFADMVASAKAQLARAESSTADVYRITAQSMIAIVDSLELLCSLETTSSSVFRDHATPPTRRRGYDN